MDALTHSDVLDESLLEHNGTRVCVVSAKECLSVDACLPYLQAIVARAKHDCGAVLLRGFDALGACGLDRFVASFGAPLLTYEFGSTPRSRIEKRVYSSTEYPADQWIDQHNEQSYTRKWPATIWFYCDVAAEQGGATPVADSRRVYERLDPALRRLFTERRVMYVRNFGNGLDVPWQQAFGTGDRQEVEAYCRAQGIGCEWLDDGTALRTKQICQSELRHPVTGETVWFNQAHLFHLSSLPAALQETLLDVVDEDRLPRNACFGDGTPIAPALLDEIRAVYRETMLSFDWQPTDLLMLDNVLMSHGRAPFSGKRRVLVAMT
jgi:alpha-ketoglutarate-dependent taurine dioxygenase